MMPISLSTESSAAAGSSAPAVALVSRQPRGDQSPGAGVMSCGLRRFVRSAARSTFLFLFSGALLAQTVDQSMPSLRSGLPPGTVTTVTVQMEGRNTLTGARILIGTKKTMVVDLVNDAVMLVDLVGPKTSATPTIPIVVTGLRKTTVIAGIPKVDIDPIVDHPKLDSPIIMPLGTFLGCRYDMPSPNFDTNQVVANAMQFMANHVAFTLTLIPAPGNLRCTVGVKAASIPAPVIQGPGPVVTGPVTPAPVVPAPAPGVSPASPAGSTAPPLASLTDKDGAVWTISGNAIFKNNVNLIPPYNDVKSLSIGISGIVRLEGSVNGYACLANGIWVTSSPPC